MLHNLLIPDEEETLHMQMEQIIEERVGKRRKLNKNNVDNYIYFLNQKP